MKNKNRSTFSNKKDNNITYNSLDLSDMLDED